MIIEPILSVVIATYNRKDVLKTNLERLAKQTMAAAEFEVVVVDDGSGDGTGDMISIVQSELPFTLRYFYQCNQGPGAANNCGAREAKADLILFLADDILASPQLLESHLHRHREHPQINVGVVGRLRESPDVPQTAFQKAWDPFKDAGLDTKKKHDELSFWVSNFSMKRKFFLEKGIFFEFPGPAMEDHELAHRLLNEGLEILYSRDALGDHYHPYTIDSAVNRSYQTGRNFMQFDSRVEDSRIHDFAQIQSRKLTLIKSLRVFLRDTIRLTLFNSLTVPNLVVPAIRKAESWKFLEPSIEFFTRRACRFYFMKGIAESHKEWKKSAK